MQYISNYIYYAITEWSIVIYQNIEIIFKVLKFIKITAF